MAASRCKPPAGSAAMLQGDLTQSTACADSPRWTNPRDETVTIYSQRVGVPADNADCLP